ncbi:MAG TPA: pyruvate ferredoxin oxidoreductase [Desulfobacterales bacterium]|nr:pyruvate ferredoxin oxidoreductase [Desulfobacterales bacterium]
MQEIRFHGRGGQGTVVASVILAKAFFSVGYYVQTFPHFGVERRGAPVEAYLRLDKKKILIRSNVYNPDAVIVQDRKLLETADVTGGLKPGGWILLNSPVLPENLEPFNGYKLAHVDATGIAVDNDLGTHTHPMINTAMTGAFSGIMETLPLHAVTSAIQEEISVKPEQNVKAATLAFEAVACFGMVDQGNGVEKTEKQENE